MFFIIHYVSGRMSGTIDPPSSDAPHAAASNAKKEATACREKLFYVLSRFILDANKRGMEMLRFHEILYEVVITCHQGRT